MTPAQLFKWIEGVRGAYDAEEQATIDRLCKELRSLIAGNEPASRTVELALVLGEFARNPPALKRLKIQKARTTEGEVRKRRREAREHIPALAKDWDGLEIWAEAERIWKLLNKAVGKRTVYNTLKELPAHKLLKP